MGIAPLRVLTIEDNPADIDLLRETIELEGKAANFDLVWENRLSGGLARLAQQPFDAVLLDLNLPDSQGLESIARVRGVAAAVPVLVMTGVSDEELALRAMQAGAQDYLLKGQVSPALLERAIRYSIERKHIQAAQERRARELEALYQTSLDINSEIELSTILTSIVERAARLLDMPLGGLYLLEPDGQHLRLAVGHNDVNRFVGVTLRIGEGVAGIAAERGAPFWVEDHLTWEAKPRQFENSPFRRVLGIPMKVRGKVIGVIHISDDRRAGRFTEDEIRLVGLFADQAAMVVEKARLLEAERQKGLELERSNRLAAALSQAAVQVQATLDIHQMMEVTGAELLKLGINLMIAQIDPSSGRLVVTYTSVVANGLAEAERLVGQPINGLHAGDFVYCPSELLTTRKPSFLPQIKPMFRHVLPKTPPEVFDDAMRCLKITEETSSVYLPMVIKDQVFGALIVWGNDLHESDIPSYNVFTSHVTAALENTRLYNEIQKLAIMDELTGLYNRRGFFTLAVQHIHLAQRVKKGVLLIFADIDGMKTINDTLGHGQGDQALIDAAGVLKQTYRSADIIARVGGDEFAILAVTGARPETGSLPERLSEQIANFNATHQRPYKLSFSTGMAHWPPGKPVDLDLLLSEADARMYEDKRARKDRR